MTDPVYVIARSRACAVEWAKGNGVELSRLRYVSKAEQLKGIREVTVHVLPGAWERCYRDNLMRELHFSESTGRVVAVRGGEIVA